MAKAKSIAEKFASLPASRRVGLTPEQEKLIAEYVSYYLATPRKPTQAALADLISTELGFLYSENVLRRRIEDAKRDKEKV